MSNPIETVILFQIDQTSKAAKRYSQREFDRLKLDITVEQWIILTIINENEHISQKALAVKSLRDPASITRTLDLLEKRGLIERQSIPDNRRQYSLILTSKGLALIKTKLPIIEEHRQKSIKGLSAEDIQTLHTLLKKIQENME